MKKVISYLIVGLLGVLLTSILIIRYVDDNHKKIISTQQEQLPAHRVNLPLPNPENTVDFVMAAEKSIHTVVHIRTQFENKSVVYDDFFGTLREFFGGESYPQRSRVYTAYGSGVIISDDGYIVTNNHVVQEADLIEVTLNDRRTFDAKIIGTDPSTDLALIKIQSNDLPFIFYGNSDELKIGEWVLAVGNPFNLTSTVTAGIVSAKARNINILGSNTAIESFIQTDAAVNRGNSGGALVNTKGELVGINAAIASNNGLYTGYSFAIPVNIVKKVMVDLMQFGSVQRAFIGISIREINSSFAEEIGLEEIKGVYVSSLNSNGGAYEAGLQEGDVILSVDDNEVNTTAELLEIIGQHRPGDEINILINRNGKNLPFEVTLKNSEGNVDISHNNEDFFFSEFASSFKPISDNEKSHLNIPYGMKITNIKDGILKQGGINEGFIIMKINNHPIKSSKDLNVALKDTYNGLISIEGIYPNGMRMRYGFIK
ncbi:MAG: Do family serine endopeptidase [Bacteroidales bacterium]|nr:Do family serine endopeptidase [Bacteroidales bacterium]